MSVNEGRQTPRIRLGWLVSGAMVAFLAVFAVGLFLAVTQPARTAFREALTDTVKAALKAPSLQGLINAGADLVLYIGVVLFQPFTVILAFVLVEIWFAGPPKSWTTTLRSLFYKAVATVVTTFISIMIARGFLMVYDQPLFLFQPGGPDGLIPETAAIAVLILAAILMDDFAFYWAHRLQHTFPSLWRFHSVHHSIENLDAANNYLHPVDQILPAIFLGLIGAFVGFGYDEFLIVSAFRVIHDHFVHSRAPLHLGPLRAILVDNRYHHFHHSRHFAHYNKNFSGYFTLWDRAFGTCHIPADDEMVDTGVRGTRQAQTLWRFLLADLDRTGEDRRPEQAASVEAGH
jgi:sterol desaturase/sphingolipid hydroxylase (fatty acid hydroxylase superfamily)